MRSIKPPRRRGVILKRESQEGRTGKGYYKLSRREKKLLKNAGNMVSRSYQESKREENHPRGFRVVVRES